MTNVSNDLARAKQVEDDGKTGLVGGHAVDVPNGDAAKGTEAAVTSAANGANGTSAEAAGAAKAVGHVVHVTSEKYEKEVEQGVDDDEQSEDYDDEHSDDDGGDGNDDGDGSSEDDGSSNDDEEQDKEDEEEDGESVSDIYPGEYVLNAFGCVDRPCLAKSLSSDIHDAVSRCPNRSRHP